MATPQLHTHNQKEKMRTGLLCGDFYFDGAVERRSLQLLHLLGHGGGVEVRDSLTRNHFEDLIHLREDFA